MFAQVTRRTERAPLAPGRPGTWGSFKCGAQDAVRSSSAHIALLLARVLGGGGLCAAPRGFRPRGPLQRSGGKAQRSQGLQGDGPPDLRAQAVRARSPSPHPRRPALGSGVPPRGAETESQGEAGGPRRRGALLPPSHLSAGSTRQQTPKH